MRTKRIEYEKGFLVKDGVFEEIIHQKTEKFVNDILDNIGKEYLIPDLDFLITGSVKTSLAKRAIQEGYNLIKEEQDC